MTELFQACITQILSSSASQNVIDSAASFVRFLRDEYPSSPPSRVVYNQDGGLLVERVDGDSLLQVEFDDSGVSFTKYVDGNVSCMGRGLYWERSCDGSGGPRQPLDWLYMERRILYLKRECESWRDACDELRGHLKETHHRLVRLAGLLNIGLDIPHEEGLKHTASIVGEITEVIMPMLHSKEEQ